MVSHSCPSEALQSGPWDPSILPHHPGAPFKELLLENQVAKHLAVQSNGHKMAAVFQLQQVAPWEASPKQCSANLPATRV